MVPSFRLMQERIDEVNRLLREQITGVRVVRAFVRERARDRAVRATPTTSSPTSRIRAGRWMAAMFPTVMLVVNVVQRRGALVRRPPGRRAAQMQVGALTAFLSYLMQILMSVMMATFMMMMVPRAAVCADRIMEVLDTDTSVRPAADARRPTSPSAARCASRTSTFAYPGADDPVSARGLASRPAPGQTLAIIGSTGAGKSTLVNLVPRLFDATAGAVLVDGVDVRDLDPEVLWARARAGAAAGVPLHRHDRLQPALRQARRDRGGDVARARDRPGPGLRRGDARRGWRPRSPRAAPTSPAASGSGWRSPGPSSGAPRSTSSTTRSPRSTSPPTPGCARRSRR